jgi:predicted DNA-binding protein (UPF0278 family)
MTFREIQEDVISKNRVIIVPNSTCWGRTHAHVKKRMVCKWKFKNSIQATFELFHEIGHICTTKGDMRRAESEYYATVWAMNTAKEYGLTIPDKVIEEYQEYIDMEIDRGLRRGGTGYGDLRLVK